MSIQFCSMDYKLPTHLAEPAVRTTVSIHSSWEPPSLFLLEQALSAIQACVLKRCEGALGNYLFSLNEGCPSVDSWSQNRKRNSCKQVHYPKPDKTHRS